jgi:hypothetical protein
LVVKGVNVITLAKAGVLSNVDLRIVDGEIREIGFNLCPHGARVVEAAGKFVLPGLIDTHVHLKKQSQLLLMLAYGVTTVRNMSGSPQVLLWKEKVASGEMVGPDIYSTGPIIDGIMFWPGFRIVRTAEEAEQAVLDDVSKGYDFVKTYPDIPREAFVRLMETANGCQMRVVGHGSNVMSAEEMIDLGYYSLEHVSRLPPDNDDDVVRLAESAMWYVPTLVALRNVLGYIKGGVEIADFPHKDLVEASMIDEWHHSVQVYRQDKRFGTFDLDGFAHLTRLYRQHSDRILLGTDVGIPGTLSGLSTHDELELLVSMGGFSPLDALLAGTVKAAKLLGRESDLGTVEVGKLADLLILDANPLDLITNTRRLGGVIKSGRYFDSNQLAGLVEECRSVVRSERS